MPNRIASLMILIALLGLALGGFVAFGRWYVAADESVRSPARFLIGVVCAYIMVFGSIVGPLFLIDVIRDAKARRLDRLATRIAEADGMRAAR